MLNDARVASLGFFKENICTTRIHKEKKFKIKFQVLLKFAQILRDYIEALIMMLCQPGNTNIDQILRCSHHVDRGSDQSLDRVIHQHERLSAHMRYVPNHTCVSI